MGKGQFLGEFEQVVLLAITRLEPTGYGATVREEVEERTGRPVSVGALYATLDRLAAKGYAAVRTGPSEPERGGRPQRFLSRRARGVGALAASRNLSTPMWDRCAWTRSAYG